MLDWMKAEAGRSEREKGEERRRRIREDWENREMLEIVEVGERVRVVRCLGEKSSCARAHIFLPPPLSRA